MFYIGLVMATIGLVAKVASMLNRKLRWWNDTRAEFVFRSIGLLLAGILIAWTGSM